MGQVTTPTNDAPITYPDRIYNGRDFDTNINREQSSDNLTTVLTDKNEVLGFPDHTSTQEMQGAIEADRNGSISTYKPTFYDKFIRPSLEKMGMSSFQPPFITDIKPTSERAFATSMARAATADIFKPEFSDQEAKANPIPAFAGSLVGSVAAFATGGALLDGLKLSQLTPFAENIIKGGILGGTYKGVSETSNELRDQDHPDLAKIGTSVLHDAMWWGGIGGIGGIGGLVGEASKPVGVAASAGLGYLMAKSDGADEPSALLNGAVLGGFHLLQSHGDQEDVRQFVTDKLQSNIADYILAKSPMVHEEVAKQGGREFISNHAQDAIDQANESLLSKQKSDLSNIAKDEQGKPIEIGKIPPPDKPFTDGYDPKMMDYLAQYIPPNVIVRMDSTSRLALANSPVKSLEAYATQHAQIAQENASIENLALNKIEEDANLARGGTRDPIDEAIKSPIILNQVMKNLTQQVIFKGEENASQGRKSTEGGSNEEGIKGEAQIGIHLRDASQGGMEAKAGEVDIPRETVTSKIAKSIEQKAVDARLTDKFDTLAGEEKVNIAEQSKLAIDLVNNDLENARSIVRGDNPLPGKLRGTALITAMEEHLKTNPDADIAHELANSPLVSATTRAAQELRLAAEREPDSFSAKMAELKKALIDNAGGEDKIGQNRVKMIEDMKKETSKIHLSKDELKWEKFLDDIKC